jgi:hypothetical protein
VVLLVFLVVVNVVQLVNSTAILKLLHVALLNILIVLLVSWLVVECLQLDLTLTPSLVVNPMLLSLPQLV